MLIGSVACETIQLLSDNGIKLTNQIDILGVTINSDADNQKNIFEKFFIKIVNLIAFWDRFKLTLPGRILVTKMYMISQINYVGSFLEPDEEWLFRTQETIDHFAIGTLKISQYRRYCPPEGGAWLNQHKTTTLCTKGGLGFQGKKCLLITGRMDLYAAAPFNNIWLLGPKILMRKKIRF